MAKKKTLIDEFEEELRQDPALDALYQRELARLRLANQIVKLREQAGLSQAALARKMGTKQAGIARMENSTYTSYSLRTLAKLAAAMGVELLVKFVPKPRRTKRKAA